MDVKPALPATTGRLSGIEARHVPLLRTWMVVALCLALLPLCAGARQVGGDATVVVVPPGGKLKATIGEASREIAVVSPSEIDWDLWTFTTDPARRMRPFWSDLPGSWNSFEYVLTPPEVNLEEVIAAGEIRLAELDPGADGRRSTYRMPFRQEGRTLRFTDEAAAAHFGFQGRSVIWNGRLPAGWRQGGKPVGPDSADFIPDPGRYRFELFVTDGKRDDEISFVFTFSDLPGALDLTGYWRVESGPMQGWLMRGETGVGGAVTLDVAPGVVLRGRWPVDAQDVFAAQPGGVSTDLLPVAGAPTDDELERLIQVPSDLVRALYDVRGASPNVWGDTVRGDLTSRMTLKREPWRIRVLDRYQPTVRFEPASTSDSLVSSKVARLAFEREPDAFVGAREQFTAVTVRVLNAAGRELERTFTAHTEEPKAEVGALSIRLFEGFIRGEVVWTGLQTDGSPHPPGVYTFELTVREGMAQQQLIHRVTLGSELKIVSHPQRFAPGHEDVEIRYIWFPNTTAPDRMELTVRAKDAAPDGVPIFSGTLVPEKTGAEWKVGWSKTHNGAESWLQYPFVMELKGQGRDGVWHASAPLETTVEIVALDMTVDEPKRPAGERGSWHDATQKEIPAEVAVLDAYAAVKVLDSQGKEQRIRCCTEVHWEYTLEPADDVPRQPGFLAADGELQQAINVPIQGGSDAAEKHRSRVRFQPPARAAGQDYVTGDPVPGDRFKLQATLKGREEFRDESDQYTIVAGDPALVRQLSPAEIVNRFHGPEDGSVSDRFDFTYLADVSEYIDTIGTYVVRWGTLGLDLGGPMVPQPVLELRDKLADWLREEKQYPSRFIGMVHGVPVRGFWGVQNKPLPVFLAGYAGAVHGSLKGGQAFLVVFEVTDKFGNKIPVAGERQRTLKVGLDNDTGLVPPFIVASRTGDNEFVYQAGGPLIAYSPFGPASATRAQPLGMHAFYYVPGIRGFSAQLSADLDELQSQLRAYGQEFVKPPDIGIGMEIDSRLRFYWEIDGALQQLHIKGETHANGIQLVSPGSYQPLPSEMEKWVKWVLFADVVDKETFLAEIRFGFIPVAGDLKEIGNFLLKKLIGKKVGTLDKISLCLSGIGLLADLGYLVPPAGLSLNAFVVGARSEIKLLQSGSKAAAGFSEFLQPLAGALHKALDDPLNTSHIAGLQREMSRVANLIGLAEDAVTRGGAPLLGSRMEALSAFLAKKLCNPDTCLTTLNRLKAEQIGKVLDEIAEVTDELHEMALAIYQGRRFTDDEMAAVATYLVELVTVRQLPQHQVENIAQLAKLMDNPLTVLAQIHRLDADGLQRAARIISNPAFVAAVQQERKVFARFIDLLTAHGDAGREFYQAYARTTEGYVDLTRLLDNVLKSADNAIDRFPQLVRIAQQLPEAVPTLTSIVKHPRFTVETAKQGIGGAQGLKDTIYVIERALHRGSQGVAGEVLHIAKKLTEFEIPASGRFIQLQDIGRVFDNLGSFRFDMYIEAIKFFRNHGTYVRGIFEPASVGSSRGFLNVAGSANNAVNFAMEVVGTKWLIEEGIRVQVSFGRFARGDFKELPAITRTDVMNFGWRHQRTPNPAETLEADVDLDIPAVGGDVLLDWKKYRFYSKLKDSDIAKAIEALANKAVENVVFLSPKVWASTVKKQIDNAMQAAGLKGGLVVAQVIAGGELARFLRGAP